MLTQRSLSVSFRYILLFLNQQCSNLSDDEELKQTYLVVIHINTYFIIRINQFKIKLYNQSYNK